MMEKYPNYETYRALYARYYDHGVADLLKLLQPLEGMSVADLCGGDGRLALAALAAGARQVLLVDAEPDMIPLALQRHKRVAVAIGDVRSVLLSAITRNRLLDRIVCQQAVNYRLDRDTAEIVAMALTYGGIFAFNTFNRKPPEKPRVLKYELNGHAFTEVGWLVGDMVHHLQIRDGLEPHHTVFSWLSPEQLRELLNPYFIINEERRGKTSLYRCEKRRVPFMTI